MTTIGDVIDLFAIVPTFVSSSVHRTPAKLTDDVEQRNLTSQKLIKS